MLTNPILVIILKCMHASNFKKRVGREDGLGLNLELLQHVKVDRKI